MNGGAAGPVIGGGGLAKGICVGVQVRENGRAAGGAMPPVAAQGTAAVVMPLCRKAHTNWLCDRHISMLNYIGCGSVRCKHLIWGASGLEGSTPIILQQLRRSRARAHLSCISE